MGGKLRYPREALPSNFSQDSDVIVSRLPELSAGARAEAAHGCCGRLPGILSEFFQERE